jgi:uncharacterized protein
MDGAGAAEPEHGAWWRRRLWWLLGASAVLLCALAITAALSWHFSSRVLVPDHSSWLKEVEVEAMPAGRIVLERTEETERPGVYGLDWEGGHAIAGPVVAESDDTVARKLRSVQGYLVPEMEVGVEANVYSGDPGQAFGLPFADVGFPDALGPMPAWVVPGRRDTWAILVHGINGTPQLGLRLVPALHRAGLPTMLITYREDLGAPPSPDGFHHMGLTEWRDLDAAARYALARGARRLVLVGASMGGSIVTQFMQHSPLASRVDGIVLDAPALDWKRVLEFNATEMGLPAFTSAPLEWAIGARIDVDWDDLDALQHSDDLQLPILLFHGDEDEVVPISLSEDFADELPRWVDFYPAPRAGHVESWNVDPPLYERRLDDFLARVAG